MELDVRSEYCAVACVKSWLVLCTAARSSFLRNTMFPRVDISEVGGVPGRNAGR